MLILRTPRLRLRWFEEADAGFLRDLVNDPGWLANIGDRGIRTRRQAARWIRDRLVEAYGRFGFGFWAVERIEDDALIGLCGMFKRDTLAQADIGYALMPAWRGQGYAREAAAACLKYGHEVLGLPEIWAITDPDNAASAAVLGAIGLRDDGVHRLAGQDEPTRLFKSARRDPGDDRAQIDALARRVLAAFANRDGAIPTFAALPHHFLPDAIIRVADPLGTVVASDLHGFIAPRAELLLRGRLQDFEEREVESRTEIDGTIAQRRLRYEKRGMLDGRLFTGGGTKLMQFVRLERGWKIASLLWTGDSPISAG